MSTVASILLLAACQASSSRPTSESVLLPGETVDGACQAAVVARAEHLRDRGAQGAEPLEADIFASCTYEEFQAANAKMAGRFQYPGDGRTYVGRNCLRMSAVHRGSLLCATR